MKQHDSTTRTWMLAALVAVALMIPAVVQADTISYVNKPIGKVGFKASDNVATHDTMTFVRIAPDTKITFNPDKRSVVHATFCAEMRSDLMAGVRLQAVIDAGDPGEIIINPGPVVIASSLETSVAMHCMTWSYFFVNPGSHNIEVMWASTSTDEIVAEERTFSVIYR